MLKNYLKYDLNVLSLNIYEVKLADLYERCPTSLHTVTRNSVIPTIAYFMNNFLSFLSKECLNYF